MASAIADTSDALPYGFAKGLLKGCKAVLAKNDPTQARTNHSNSSMARRDRNYLRSLPRHALVKELFRREMVDKARTDAKERKERFLMRQKRTQRNAN